MRFEGAAFDARTLRSYRRRQTYTKDGYKCIWHLDDRVLRESGSHAAVCYPPDIDLQPIKVDHWVGQGDEFEILGETVEVRHVPGHCPGNILFYQEHQSGVCG